MAPPKIDILPRERRSRQGYLVTLWGWQRDPRSIQEFPAGQPLTKIVRLLDTADLMVMNIQTTNYFGWKKRRTAFSTLSHVNIGMELVLNHFGCATRSDGRAVDGTASLTDVAGNDGIFYKSNPPEMTIDFSLVSCLRWCPIVIAKLVTPKN
jgi:hypothetical protein